MWQELFPFLFKKQPTPVRKRGESEPPTEPGIYESSLDVIANLSFPVDLLPIEIVPGVTTWRANHRYVCPYWEMYLSEARVPHYKYVSGYQYSMSFGIPNIALQSDGNDTYFYLEMFSRFQGLYTDMHALGSLDLGQCERLRISDHPGVSLPSLGDSKSGSIWWAREGWFAIWSSKPLHLAAWTDFYDKVKTQQMDQLWTHPLSIYERSGDLGEFWFPKVESSITEQWST